MDYKWIPIFRLTSKPCRSYIFKSIRWVVGRDLELNQEARLQVSVQLWIWWPWTNHFLSAKLPQPIILTNEIIFCRPLEAPLRPHEKLINNSIYFQACIVGWLTPNHYDTASYMFYFPLLSSKVANCSNGSYNESLWIRDSEQWMSIKGSSLGGESLSSMNPLRVTTGTERVGGKHINFAFPPVSFSPIAISGN